MKLKIILADDHTVTRAGIRSVLEANGNYQIVAEAENGRDAVCFVNEEEPDIAILDITMPDLNGIDAAVQILQSNPGVKIVILSMHSDKQYVERALKVGISGYLLKDCALDEILDALKAIEKGNCYLSPNITGIVFEHFQKSQASGKPPSSPISLSMRENEVLQLLTEGKTTKEIASIINVSIKTIEAHRKQIMDKLGLNSIAQLTKYAIREGLTSLED